MMKRRKFITHSMRLPPKPSCSVNDLDSIGQKGHADLMRYLDAALNLQHSRCGSTR
jgi:hypothetical protein